MFLLDTIRTLRHRDRIRVFMLTGKSLLASCNDDCANILVLVILAQCIIQLHEKRAAERIKGLGSVESN